MNDEQKHAVEKEEITMHVIPKAVNYLINEVAEMRVLLEHIEKQLGLGVDKHRPIGIEDACRILGISKNTLCRQTRETKIPHYKQGGKVYFFEAELLDWIQQGRIKTVHEREDEYMRSKTYSRKPKY